MTDPNDEAVLRRLRERIGELEATTRAADRERRADAVIAAIAVAMIALTASGWYYDPRRGGGDTVISLWGLVEQQGFVPLLALSAIFAVGVATLAGIVGGRYQRVAHIVLSIASLSTIVAIVAASSRIDEDYRMASAPWVVMIGAMALCGLHGGKAGRGGGTSRDA